MLKTAAAARCRRRLPRPRQEQEELSSWPGVPLGRPAIDEASSALGKSHRSQGVRRLLRRARLLPIEGTGSACAPVENHRVVPDLHIRPLGHEFCRSSMPASGELFFDAAASKLPSMIVMRPVD